MRDTRHGQGGGGASGAGGGRKCVQELENISDLFIFSRLVFNSLSNQTRRARIFGHFAR